MLLLNFNHFNAHDSFIYMDLKLMEGNYANLSGHISPVKSVLSAVKCAHTKRHTWLAPLRIHHPAKTIK